MARTGFRVKVRGDKALIKAFEKAVAGKDEGLLAARDKIGRIILRTAKARVPVDTGTLRDSLEIKPIESTAKKTRIGVILRPGTRSSLGIPASAKGFYPVHVELGSVGVSPQPYLRPALDENQREIGKIIGNVLGRKLGKLFG